MDTASRHYSDDTVTRQEHAEVIACIAAERNAALAEVERLREAMASALTSLATGPMKDGYAYAVLDEALSTSP